MLILADAELDNAVRAAAFGGFMHQGQICMSTERIVIDSSIADEFVGKLAQRAGKYQIRATGEAAFELGSMISCDAASRSEDLVKDAVAKGATLLAGGNIRGATMSATVLDRVTPAMKVFPLVAWWAAKYQGMMRSDWKPRH